MAKIQISGIFGARVLFVLILFFLSGCATATKPQAKKRFLDDVLVFRYLEQVDLDRDGVKEIIAIYATGNNSSGVKVIKFHNDKGDVVFQRIFNTPDVKLLMKKNIPTLIVEESVQVAAGCRGGRIKSVYRWDGKAFTPSGR